MTFLLISRFFERRPHFLLIYGLTFVINGSLFWVATAFAWHESLTMVLYALSLYTSTMLLYRDKLIKSIFSAICFGVNIFALSLIIKSSYSLATGVCFFQTTIDPHLAIWLRSVVFICAGAYLLLAHMLVKDKYIRMVNSSSENMRFICLVLSVIFCFVLFNTTNLYIPNQPIPLTLIQLKIGITSIIGFLAAITYGFLLSRIMLFRTSAYEIESQINIQNQEQARLQFIAYQDDLTGCYNRTFGVEYLEETIALDNALFAVAFFDLDGLKIVNDTYGHAEGDEYIKAVVNILKNTFGRGVLCRMGGDEFMVVLRDVDGYIAQKYAMQAYDAVAMLSQMSSKLYPVSISYGLLEVTPKMNLTSNEILEVVDTRMYEFKRNHKKARKV